MSDEKKKKSSKLHRLYTYKTKLADKLKDLVKRRTILNKEIVITETALAKIVKGIESITNRDIFISTHFIERYRERTGELQATEEDIKEKVLTPDFIRVVKTLGSGTYPYKEFKIIIEDNKLISILYDKPEKYKSDER